VIVKKRRQHYVWQYYLRGWEVNGNLWCSREGKVFQVGTKNVAVERDFYRLKEMRPSDLQFVREVVINRFEPVLRAICEGWVPHFTELFAIKARYEQSGSTDPEIEAQIDTSINNIEEDLHAWVEGPATRYLDELRRSSITFLEDGEAASLFAFFFALQYMRTPTRRNAFIANLQDRPEFRFDASWGLLRTVLATAFGFYMNRQEAQLRLTFLIEGR